MNTPMLALRNVLRNRRRTLITVTTIGIAAMAIAMLGGYVSSTLKGLQTATVRTTGHLQIMTEGYLSFGRGAPDRYAIADYAGLVHALQSDPVLAPLVRVLTPVLHVQGVAGYFPSGRSTTFAAQSWEPADRERMLSWDGLAQGLPAQAGNLDPSRGDAGVVGVGLAQLLDLCGPLELSDCERDVDEAPADAVAIPDDLAALGRADNGSRAPQSADVAVELLAAGTAGAPNVVRMNLIRAEQQGVRELDMMYVGMPLALGQRLLFGPNGGGASALVVQLHRSSDIEPAKARIAELLERHPDQRLEVRRFEDIQPAYVQVVSMFNTLFHFVTLLMLVVTLFSVANTVNMAVSERTGEIGSLRAIGLRRSEIRSMFVLEGGLLGLIGALAGVLTAAMVSVWGINRAGLSWTPPNNITPVPISIDLAGTGTLLVTLVVAMTLIACLSAWWPARRAARLEIVEALRHA